MSSIARHIVLTVASCHFILACDSSSGETPSEIDLALFSEPADFSELEMSQIAGQTPFSYLELRKQETFSSSFSVLKSAGVKCEGAAEMTSCIDSFDQLKPIVDDGFYYVGHPNDQFHYFATTHNDTMELVTNVEMMRSFLGRIDNSTEALFLAAASGYYWASDNLDRGAIRETSDGFQLLVTKTNLCPIETKGFLLSVSSDGDITILNSWIIVPAGNLCS